MKLLICCDRDGTINKDENYYLGKDNKWKNQIEFLPGVIDGIKQLNDIPESHFFIITNQTGVALKDFPNLTEASVNAVNDYMVGILEEKGLKIDGCYSAFYASKAHFDKYSKKGYQIDKHYVTIDEHPDHKPRTGMIKKAASSIGWDVGDADVFVYVIGDRISDVITGLNAGGKGILVPTFKTKEGEDTKKTKELMSEYSGRVFIANNFLDAVRIIEKDIKRHSSKSE